MCEVDLLTFLEIGEQPSCFHFGAPVPLQARNQRTLTGDVSLTEGDVFLSLSKRLPEQCSIHTGKVARRVRTSSRAVPSKIQ